MNFRQMTDSKLRFYAEYPNTHPSTQRLAREEISRRTER